MYFVIVLCSWALWTVATGILWGCDYPGCGQDNPNTMCKYPGGINRFEPWCMGRGAGVREMTDDMRRCVLDQHNQLRQKVALGDTDPLQPTAANMMKLRYNRDAERVVQRWLDQCKSGHDSCRNLRNGTPCGQNLWYSSGSSSNDTELKEAVCGQAKAYYSEIQFLAGRTKEQCEQFYFSWDAGHYTAMTWAEVKEIGCAWFQAAIGRDNQHPVKAGCNYVGSPNLIGGEQYKVGMNCSQCPDGAHCSVRYPGLCTYESEEDEYNDVTDSSHTLALTAHSALALTAVLVFVNVL